MEYSPDPGGNFASDAHRRVLAHLSPPERKVGKEIVKAEPLRVDQLLDRLRPDWVVSVDFEQLEEILGDLEAAGDAVGTESGWQQTEQGFEVLSGPIAEEGGRKHRGF